MASLPPQPDVAPADIEALLTHLSNLPGDPRLGFFGPASVTWQVNRESAVFLGAGRAALLQVAHPWVAASLAQHSNLLHDAIGRFHSTFRVLYTMLFGTRAQALASARQLHRRHTTITGHLPSAVGAHSAGEPYSANHIPALLWVHATLVLSAVDAYNLVLPPLTPTQRELYYAESKHMAALFGIPPAALPRDWSAFTRYTDGMLSPTNHDLAVDPAARALGASVLSGVGTRIRPPRWYHALTASWLPPHLRDHFDLPWTPQTQRSAARATRWLPLAYRSIPRHLRSVGPFHEATARLRNRPPGPSPNATTASGWANPASSTPTSPASDAAARKVHAVQLRTGLSNTEQKTGCAGSEFTAFRMARCVHKQRHCCPPECYPC